MNARKLATAAATIATASLLLSACAADSSSSGADETLKIGLNIPLSGTVAYMGEGYQQGAQLAVDQINADGGINGTQLELVSADGECAPQAAVTAARQLVDVEGVNVMMGAICSSAGLAVMELLPSLEVANLGVLMTNPTITEKSGVGGNDWMFRLNVSDAIMADSFSRLIAEDADTVTIFAVNDDFGRGVADVYTRTLEDQGSTVAGVEYYEHGEPDYRAVLSRVKQDDPDALLLAMEYGDANVFMRQFHELGMTQQVFARGSVVGDAFLDLIKDDPSIGEGIREASMWAPGIDTEQNEAMMAAFEDEHGTPVSLYGAMAYYGVQTIAEAAKSAKSLEPADLKDALKTVDFDSGIGPIAFDDHHQAHPFVSISSIESGKITLDSLIESGSTE